MEDAVQSLLSRLVQGPSMLLLGQALDGTDGTDTAGPTLPLISRLGRDANSAYQRFDRDIRSRPEPQWLLDIAQYPWNGVFTSRIDSGLAEIFNCDWRRVIPTAEAQLGRHPRSSTELQVRYLFGGIGLPEDERPPVGEMEEAETRARVSEILNTLADTLVTPRGVIIIEGYGPGDWLTPRDLFTFATRLQAGQAHLFSATEQLLDNQFIRGTIERGVLVAHADSFSSILAELEESGRFQRSAAGRGAAGQRIIPVGDSFMQVDVSIWNRVISAARPIDTELLEPFTASSSTTKYQRFRTFLGAAEGVPPWKAVASGYNMRRDFEDALSRRVREILGELSQPEPVIVAGQTATGKTIALCDLALQVARSGEAAVLHRSRRGDRPTLADIDSYASWVEEDLGVPTLFIWDGMANIDEYYTLQRQLRSRGRRVLIVGSCYLPPESGRPRPNIIRVSSNLSKAETGRIKQWLSAYGVPVSEGTSLDSSFLALLYRLLPDTERSLRRGLTLEIRTAERELENLSKINEPSDETRLSAVARALADAGFNIHELMPSDHPHGELRNLSFENRSSTEKLTAMILVAGRRGLPLPLELALRIIGREGASRIVNLVKNFDIFRWTEADNGSQYLGTRTRLEAELLAREDLNINSEVEVVIEMIEDLRFEPTSWGGEEVEFIVELMEFIGPKSQQSSRYASHWLNLAGAFRDLRENRGRTHHRLVLQEANLTREYVMWAQRTGISEGPERIALLHEIQRLLEVTLEEGDAPPRSRLNLLVELASTEGAQVFELSMTGDHPAAGDVSALMGALTNAALSARAIDPENVYPVDVVAWATMRAVETGVLPERTRIDLLASAQASLDSIEPDLLSPAQQARYHSHQAGISRLLDDPALEAQHLLALTDIEDPAAYYFLARSAAQRGAEGMEVAFRSLMRAPVEVRSDWRCSRLLLDLFWEYKTGKRFLSGEREVVSFTSADWRECLEIADAIPDSGDFDRYRLDFLRGMSLFHLGSYQNSKEVFQRLDRESVDLSSRIVAKYLVSNSDGTAQVFTGRVLWASMDGRRGTAWVDQLKFEIPFVPQRFSVSDFRRKGDVLPAFHISFNMRGALADPMRSPRRTEKVTAGVR